ncbi:MAG: UDP-glucose/GDP-mannose dehydrogenase family protein [Aeromicrobium sp.]
MVTDPEANANARAKQPDLTFAESVEEALEGAELVLLLTEWDEFVGLDPVTIAPLVTEQRILDGRNALDPAAWRAAGWTYRALGRGKH